MNYIITETQFNVLSQVHEQIQLLADISAQVKDNEIRIRANAFIGTVHHLERQLCETLKAISDS